MVRESKSTRGTAAKTAPRARRSDGLERVVAVSAAADAVEAPAKVAVAPPEVERPAAKAPAATVAMVPAVEAPVIEPTGAKRHTDTAVQEPKQDDSAVAAREPVEAAAPEPAKQVDAAPESVAKPAGTKPATPEAEAPKPAVSGSAAPERVISDPVTRNSNPAGPPAVDAPIREPLAGGSVAAKPAAVRSKPVGVAKPPQPERAAAGAAALQGITARYWQEQLERTMTAGRAMVLCGSPEEAIRLQLGYVQGSLVAGIDRIGDVARWSQAALRETLLPRSR